MPHDVLMGGLNGETWLVGTPSGAERERVPNITPHPEAGIGRWSPADLADLLKLGMTPDGDFVGGSIAEVVRHSTGKLAANDVNAIVAYVRMVPPVDNKVPAKPR